MDPKSVFILGRQPAIGRAELESLVGAEHLHVLADDIIAADLLAASIPFSRLGGSIRLGTVIESVPATSWPELAPHITAAVKEHLTTLPTDGKLKLGLS